jgi:hypothetical protein
MTLVGDEVAGDSVRDERWIRRSLRKLEAALAKRGQRLGRTTIRWVLRAAGIRSRGNVKHRTPKPHPDRDKQFRYLMRTRRTFVTRGNPVISVDTMETQKIGLYGQPGRAWNKAPPEVYSLDFPRKDTVRAVPYGIYDSQANRGLIGVGVSGNTADFGVEAIVRWWQREGRRRYAGKRTLLILADGGGAKGCRPRRWRLQLQRRLADPCGLTITVCHYPPGASKWNPIEHRLFCQVSLTWAGLPLTSLELMIAAMRSTTTATGLRVEAFLLDGQFPTKLPIDEKEWALVFIRHHLTCPTWNYTIWPRINRKLFADDPYTIVCSSIRRRSSARSSREPLSNTSPNVSSASTSPAFDT